MADHDDKAPGYGSAMLAELLQALEGDGAPPPHPPPPPSHPARRAADRGGGPRAAIAAAVVAALVLAGGTGVLFATGLLGAPSKSSYVAKADAVCRRTDPALAATAKAASYPALSTAAATFSTAAEGQLSELRRVRRPAAGARGGAAAVLRVMDATVASSRRLQAAAAGSDDVAAAAAARDITAMATDAGSKAKAYGFTVCATGLAQGGAALTSGAHDLVKAVVVAKGNALCKTFEKALAAVPTPRGPKDLVPAMNKTYDLTHQLMIDLKALPVAPGDEKAFADLASVMNQEDAKILELRNAAISGNAARVGELTKSDNADRAFEIQVDGYGLPACGTDFKY